MFDGLGDTADDIAHQLNTLGLRGVRNAVRFLNPVVRYCQTKLPRVRDVDVIIGHALRITHLDGATTEIPLPDAVIEFMALFNEGEYPMLELPE